MSKRLAVAILLLCLVAAGCRGYGSGSSTAKTKPTAQSERAAVRSAFDSYRSAALAKNGSTAADLLNKTSLDYYDGCRRDALTLPEKELGIIGSPSKLLTVLAMRAEFDAGTLKSLTAEALVANAVSKGMVGAEGLRRTALGEVLVDGDVASAPALADGKPAGFQFLFSKEQDRWKLDITALNRTADPVLSREASEAHLSTPDYVDRLLAARYGAAKVKSLHRPLQP